MVEAMRVFISWSGNQSKALARALRSWLPKVIQSLEPRLSAADIESGAGWLAELNRELRETSFGLICVTRENMDEAWLLFEAGAISKGLGGSAVCPVLLDLEPSDLKGPLAQFQAVRLVHDEVLSLVLSLNQSLAADSLSEEILRETFEVWWPRLEATIKKIPDGPKTVTPVRDDCELLEEVLETVRRLDRRPADLPVQLNRPSMPDDLEPLERRIFEMRYGLDGQHPKSGPKISEALGLTESEFRALDQSLLRKMGVFGNK